MLSSSQILVGLTSLASEWQIIAVGWHLLLGSLLLAMGRGWRPSTRLLGVLLSLPLASVSVLAWWSGNVFNGAVFASASASVAGLGLRLRAEPVVVGSLGLVVAGSALAAFGWTYPHFLPAGSWLTYLYAAPLGVVPCPTLSAVIGIALVARGTESRALAGTLAASGLFYGAIGAMQLDVSIDFVLLGGAALLAVVVLSQAANHREYSRTSRHVGEASMRKIVEAAWGAAQIAFHIALGPVLHHWRIRWGANDAEIHRRLPGDELVPDPTWSYNHAVTIRAPRSAVWPWLLQLGQRRGGFYSYELLENLVGCDIHNVSEIRPELQRLAVGDIIRMHGSGYGPPVTVLEPARALVLGGPPDPSDSRVTWGFYLLEAPDGTTRLLERGRSAMGKGALARLAAGPYLLDPIGFVMSRKMLNTIKRLAEREVIGAMGTA